MRTIAELPVLNPIAVVFIFIAIVFLGVAAWMVYDTIRINLSNRKAQKAIDKAEFMQKYKELEGIIYLDKKKVAKEFVREELKKLALMKCSDREHCQVLATQWMRKYFNEK
jgi:hypothetical protein